MFFGKGVRDPVAEGVHAGLSEAFAPGGSFSTALGKEMEPIFDELRALRVYKLRHSWRPIHLAPEWTRDGRPMLLARNGDLIFGAYQQEAGEEGYWDGDIEFGGSPIQPPPDHILILPKTPKAPAPTSSF